MMRVTHVITRLIVGGAQENTISSVLGLQKKTDLEVDLVSGPSLGREGSLESVFDKAPQLLTLVPSLVRPVHPLKDFVALRNLTTIFRQRKPWIVHTHSGKAGILGRIAARKAGVPIIIHSIHGPSFGQFQGLAANCIFRAAERHAGKFTTHFVTVANAMRDQYLAAGIGNPDQYTRIFSGFALEPFLSAVDDANLRKNLGINPDDIVVGKIGRLFKLKGHDDLISVAPELVKRIPTIKFLLVGDGPWRERFEARVKDLRLRDHFVFTGLLAPSDVPRLVGIMDMLVHLSLREGLPRALPQALAAAKPVVAYDCDGAREVCLENETGFLIQPGDHARLIERISQLAANPDLRSKLGSRGQQFVQGRFSVETMVDDLYALYLRLKTSNARQSQ